MVNCQFSADECWLKMTKQLLSHSPSRKGNTPWLSKNPVSKRQESLTKQKLAHIRVAELLKPHQQIMTKQKVVQVTPILVSNLTVWLSKNSVSKRERPWLSKNSHFWVAELLKKASSATLLNQQIMTKQKLALSNFQPHCLTKQKKSHF